MDWQTLFSRDSMRKMRDYLGFGTRGMKRTVVNPDQLRMFITTRASHVSQTSLYGYLKTRAGTRFPELFESPSMLESINIAKWQTWIACVSDLSAYTGGCLCWSGALNDAQTGRLMGEVADDILDEIGIPPDAGTEFGESRIQYRDRIGRILWASLVDGDQMFTESPSSLVKWAPIVDEYKRLDREIVLNSVRFRWIEVRQSARKLLVPESIAVHALADWEQRHNE